VALSGTVAGRILGVGAPILTPVLGVAFAPAPPSLRLVGSVVRILRQLLSLPTSASCALTFRFGTKALLKYISARIEPLTTTRTALLAHGIPPQPGLQGSSG
jgi:hypothetical protein